MVKKIGRLIRLVLLFWMAILGGVLGVTLLWPDDAPPPARADAIICLGAGMSLQGWERPDAASERRARTCATLFAAGVAPQIVFTGHGHDIMSAAEAMSRVARNAGVPETAMVLEERAQSTIQNAAFSLALLPEEAERVVIVSDAFHLPRSWVIFRAFGAEHVALYSATSTPTEAGPRSGRTLIEWVFREFFALINNAGRAAVYFGAGMFGVDRATRIGWFD